MTVSQARRKAENMERFAPKARSLAQSLALSRAFDKLLSFVESMPHDEDTLAASVALERAMTVQVEMWRARCRGDSN